MQGSSERGHVSRTCLGLDEHVLRSQEGRKLTTTDTPYASLFGGGRGTLLRKLSLRGYRFTGTLRERGADFLGLDLS